ncbi:hypothetical protein CDAR_567691 [Caerostris darwini]|uniref:Uncharacterized protein n=1 Tax=Caerostris darwini TaxID=1538125 RepID=A0AAV4WC67_9ARAC|nr:hypothetical protein CDAR_567691 [Caerostris darwini]
MDDTPDTDRKVKGKQNFHIFFGMDSSEKRVGGQASIHHREGDVLFKRIRRRPPIISAGDKPDISTTDGALSRGARAIFGESFVQFSPSSAKKGWKWVLGLSSFETNDSPTPVMLRFWVDGRKV